ncbi:importin subunit beta-1 [Cinnamomum micranthum f. kanehirae]|uniref:Importin subunit beta-1 n=1 Tax=Cinnamomum micranthum f. kanehirae TaxID=337451 RepID=A0A443Q3A2_9MAGN|nr:importin subunit beta-1 [Cinnamomum micranthum f. kanehirae]
MLLETLLKQEDDQDQDEGAWNISMAGGTCLGLVAWTVTLEFVPLVLRFIKENIAKPDWRQREAATYAFGSILEGPSPDKLMPIVNVALNFMLNALTKDPNNHVNDSTAWTLGRIFELFHGSTVESPIITNANCQQMLTVLFQSMKDVPNVAEKALAKGYEDTGSSSLLSPFFQDIVWALLIVTHRVDAGESRLQTAAYETLNEVARCSADETVPTVLQRVPVIMMELNNTVEAQKLSSEEKARQNESQGLLCGCLQVIIQKLGVCEPTKHLFMQYADQVCAITVGVVGDICRALEEKILPYCDGIMTQLLKDLSSNQLHRSVKPPIFSCFGDIALAIGENFEKYLIYAMPTLQGAAEVSTHTSGADDEMTEYMNMLRNEILEAYSGYCTSLSLFLINLFLCVVRDDVVTKTAVGLLGDLADALGGDAGPLISQAVASKNFLNECLSSDDHLTKESADWAQLAVSRAVAG